jgi:hypothetical protein
MRKVVVHPSSTPDHMCIDAGVTSGGRWVRLNGSRRGRAECLVSTADSMRETKVMTD